MKVQTIQISSILGGKSSSPYLYADGQFLNSIAIDPDLPISDSNDFLASGMLRPVSYASFDGAQVTGTPMFILTNPKDTNVYVYLNNGRVVSYSSSLASEALVATASTSTGNGACYYNNYLYFATGTDIDRYGPLNGTPAYDASWWTDRSLTALTNTTYPTVRDSVLMPNHPMCVHGDGALYIGDYINGQGLIHKIKTSKTTAEGDTDNGSAYNVLDLPFGYMPTSICSYGTDLVIGAIQTTNGTVAQGKAALFFWDAINSSFYAQIDIPDSILSAVKSVNGVLYLFSGSLSDGGYRMSYYAGGYTIKTVYFSQDGYPPLSGAVDAIGDKIIWGTVQKVQTTSTPEYYAVAMSYGSKSASIPSGVQCIANSSVTATSSQGIISALAMPLQSSFSLPQVVMGWKDDSAYGLDKRSTTYGTAIWHSPIVQIGRKAIIRRIRFNLPLAVGANMTIVPKVFIDNQSSSSIIGLRTINNTNYAKSERFIEFKPDINVINNFFLELRWSGSALAPVQLPIEIDIEPILD